MRRCVRAQEIDVRFVVNEKGAVNDKLYFSSFRESCKWGCVENNTNLQCEIRMYTLYLLNTRSILIYLSHNVIH